METKKKVFQVYQLLNKTRKQLDPEVAQGLVNILVKILTNIKNNPGIQKYRVIKKDNKVLKKKVFVHANVDQVLVAMGFVFDQSTNQYMYFDSSGEQIDNYFTVLDGINLEIQADINNSNTDPEVVKERLLTMEREREEKQKKINEINDLAQYDRAEKKRDLKDHPITGSKGKKLKFGAHLKKCSDILPPPGQSK